MNELSKEMEFFIFLLNHYAAYKNTTADKILKELETENGVQYTAPRSEAEQVSLGAIGEGEVLSALRRCQPDTLTPIEAMQLIYELKQKLK